MKGLDARSIVEHVRQRTQLWLPPLTNRRGFSSSRIEHLLNGLVYVMPTDEVYLEIGSLEGRTLEAAAIGNNDKKIVGCDPGLKYNSKPEDLPNHVTFHDKPWRSVLELIDGPIGCVFYDAGHSTVETETFLGAIEPYLADEAVVVLDDWDRISVRRGAKCVFYQSEWQLLAEMPEYGDGITCPAQWFGWMFGVAVLGWKR